MPEYLDLIKRMVAFSPVDRSNAIELISLPIFDKIRNVELEQSSPIKVTISFIKKDESIKELTKAFYKELYLFNQL